jgi:hypothetical protein
MGREERTLRGREKVRDVGERRKKERKLGRRHKTKGGNWLFCS